MAHGIGRLMVAMALFAAPAAAMAQGSVGSSGQQHSQPSANQNQPQAQTDNNQQPPNAKVLPPTTASQSQPNPLPQLSK